MSGVRSRRPVFWLLAAIVALAALARFRALAFGLPFTQARPDETFIIEAARTMLSGKLPQFFDYPWLFIFLVALGDLGYFVLGWLRGTFHTVADMVASWPTHWDPFFLIPRALSAIAGTLTVPAVYRLGRQLRDETTGLVSALFMAFAFIHARDSHFGTTDTTMTLFIVMAVSVLLDADRTQQRRSYALAGALAGLAAATKYNAVILGVPMAIVYGLRLTDPKHTWREALLDKRLLYMGGAFLATFAIGIPFVVLNPDGFMGAMHELMKSMREGDPRLQLENGWIHHLRLSLRYGIGLPLFVASLIGIPVALRLGPRAATVALSFPIAYYIVAGSIRNLFFRYMIPAVPFLCVTAAIAVCWIAARIIASRANDATGSQMDDALSSRAHDATAGRSSRAAAMAAVLALLLIAPSVKADYELDRVLAARDSRQVVADWMEANAPDGSSLLQSGSRFAHARFALNKHFQEWRWDGARNAFMWSGIRAVGKPDFILLLDSPLPSSTQPIVLQHLSEGYTKVAEFKATPLDEGVVYDRQDGFFVPFTGLDRIERPGPNFTIFRRDAAPAHDSGSVAQ